MEEENQPKFNPVVEWAHQNVTKNRNRIIGIFGPTGSAKTYIGLKLCEDGAKREGTSFTIKDNLAFSFVDLLKKTMLPQNQKPGVWFQMEEAGAVGSGTSFRQWQQEANIFLNSVLQTNRCKRQCFVFTTPSFSYIDASSRKLFHMAIQTKSINTIKKESYSRPYVLQTNSLSGKCYFKLMRFTINGKKGMLKFFVSKLPSQDLIDEYEKVKLDYVNKLNNMIIRKLDDSNKREMDTTKPYAPVHIDLDILKGLVDKGYSKSQLAAKFNCSIPTIANYKRKLRQLNTDKGI